MYYFKWYKEISFLIPILIVKSMQLNYNQLLTHTTPNGFDSPLLQCYDGISFKGWHTVFITIIYNDLYDFSCWHSSHCMYSPFIVMPIFITLLHCCTDNLTNMATITFNKPLWKHNNNRWQLVWTFYINMIFLKHSVCCILSF